ncbi:MAG: MATE family efflux transporter [Bacillota bacterium]|nr:MATE family efflux transporter [Bacillota bacterium]
MSKYPTENKGIGREFKLGSLLAFALPTMIMMVFTSLYVIVDGIFVARFVSSNALAAINIMAPAFSLAMAISIMLAAGSSAIIARHMGEGNIEAAHKGFTFITIVTIVIALASIILGLIFFDGIIAALGANEAIYPYCRDYFIVILFFVPTYMLQMLFQSMFITNGTPSLGMALTVAAGIVNMVFDYILIVPCNMGIAGAALATGLGTLVPSLFGIAYFGSKRGALRFCKPKVNWALLGRSCINGSSEMVSNLAYGLITFLYNITMMRLIGEDGVAAITVIQYAEFLMSSLFFGFSMGVAPIFSYNYGSGNRPQTKRIFKICVGAVGAFSLFIFALAEIFGHYVVGIFAPPGTGVYELAAGGFRIFSVCFILVGFNVFASALFTALNNGKISAIISFLRTFIFISAVILILPEFIGVTGVWLAVPIGEALAFALSLFMILKKKNEYGYL